jgi:putative membrane protein
MENSVNTTLEKKLKPLIIGLSIFIPLAVAMLFQIEIKGVDFSFFPPIYSSINAIVAVLLVLAVIQIKKGNREKHRFFIRLAILGSILFLIGYILYHGSSGEVKYGDINNNGELSDSERNLLGADAYIYYFMLITHIILSIAIIPMVLLTYLKGWTNNLASHRKLAKYTFPLWLYVAITGPVIYLMISPYYPS